MGFYSTSLYFCHSIKGTSPNLMCNQVEKLIQFMLKILTQKDVLRHASNQCDLQQLEYFFSKAFLWIICLCVHTCTVSINNAFQSCSSNPYTYSMLVSKSWIWS